MINLRFYYQHLILEMTNYYQLLALVVTNNKLVKWQILLSIINI